ncbi:MAG TPA: rod shape-determining protein RodA, partial [Rhodospirillales bacterium]|nr:rod shape-determining protein RodA [Rhodospirillales bacterium]
MQGRLRSRELTFEEKLRALHWPFVLLVPMLAMIGYAVLYSAAGGAHEPWAWRHAVRFSVGFLVMLVIALVDIRFWFRWAYVIFAATLVLLVAVDVAGSFSKGAQRWLNLGFFQLQPSELAKVTLVMALARFLHAARLEDIARPVYLLMPLAMIGVPAALVLLQPDLGTAVMLVTVGGAMLFLGGVRWWKFLLAGGLVAASLPVLWANLRDYQRQRVLTFLDPERD